MGDIADGMISGDFDCITGEYLGEGGGFPRTRQKEVRKKRVYDMVRIIELATELRPLVSKKAMVVLDNWIQQKLNN